MTTSQLARTIVEAAGGEIVGRTRLQKIAYVLSRAGFVKGLTFSYHHFGPYSEDLTRAIDDAVLLKQVSRVDHTAGWGGNYSIFRTTDDTADAKLNKKAKDLASFLADKNAVILELAATAIFLADEGVSDAWSELRRRKPSKSSDENMKKATELVRDIYKFSSLKALPAIQHA